MNVQATLATTSQQPPPPPLENKTPRITNAMIPTGVIMIAPSGKVLTEASTLGLKPGQWPTVFETDLGNRQPLEIFEMSTAGDEIVSATYRQRYSALTMFISND